MKKNKQSKQNEPHRIRREDVSVAVIKRLPRYFRYLREIKRMDKSRISSSEMSKMMNVTASQIRQDLNCFGGFGQQGYGYNVDYLYSNICELLGVDKDFKAVVIGAGNLGKALVRSPMFEKRGVEVVAMFDVNDAVVGKLYGNGFPPYEARSNSAPPGYGIPITLATLSNASPAASSRVEPISQKSV